MSWLESHQSLRDHPKKDRLAELLLEGSVPVDVADYAALGILHYLWYWALDYARDGDLSRFSDRQVAKGCRWSGDAALLVRALTEAGFLDADRRLHDWRDYAGKLLEGRERNAERMRQARAAHVPRTADARAGLPTVPNLPTVPTDQPRSDSPQVKDPPCPVCAVDLDALSVAEEWRAAAGTRGLVTSRALLELGRRTCEECRRLGAPADCEALAETCREVFVGRLRQAIRRAPASMPAYLASMNGAPPDRLIDRLSAAKRTAQHTGAGLSAGGEPQRLVVCVPGDVS